MNSNGSWVNKLRALVRAQTFGGLNEEQFREQAERLKRIREVSADFLAALKRTGG